MSSNYILRKNRNKRGSSLRGSPGIGFNLTVDGDYDISEHKLVNVKQPENPGDVVNLEYLDAHRLQVNEVHTNMLKKDDAEIVIEIVKPELSKLRKKIKRDGLLQYQENINVTATSDYIDIGNRRLIKTADAVDTTDVVNKGQLDIYENRLIKLETEFMQSLAKLHEPSKDYFEKFIGKIVYIEAFDAMETMLRFSIDGDAYLTMPFDVEVIKFDSTANLKDLQIHSNKRKIDFSKPFIIKENDLIEILIKREKVRDAGKIITKALRPYNLDIPIKFYMIFKRAY